MPKKQKKKKKVNAPYTEICLQNVGGFPKFINNKNTSMLFGRM